MAHELLSISVVNLVTMITESGPSERSGLDRLWSTGSGLQRHGLVLDLVGLRQPFLYQGGPNKLWTRITISSGCKE
jgi:hypothetical protein